MTHQTPEPSPAPLHDNAGQQAAELAAMRRMLNLSRGVFSLSIAVCNSPALRDHLIASLRQAHSGIVVVSVPRGASDPYGVAQSQADASQPEAVFITDLERVIASDDQHQHVIRSLNASRELWARHFKCPVVFWVPEYAAGLLSMHARDFWRYRSHRFEFVSEFATAAAGVRDVASGDLSAASNLSLDEKHFRIAELEQRIRDAGQFPDPALLPHVFQWLNELYSLNETIGKFNDAEAACRRILELSGEDIEWQAITFGNLGIVMRTRGNLDGAEAMHRKALEINERLGRLEGMAGNYGNLGLIMQTRGDLDGAEAMHRKALEINERLGRLEGMASNYSNLGLIMRTRGDLDGAEAMHRKALEIDEKIGNLEGMAGNYGNLGNVMQTRGDLDGAEAMHRKALELNARLGRLEGTANQYGNLGLIMEKRGDLDGAEAMLRKALEMSERLGCLEGMATAYGNLGVIMQKRDDLDEAEAMHRKSLEIEEKLGRLEGMARAYGNLGLIMEMRGDLDGSREIWSKSRDLFVKIGARRTAEKVQGWIDTMPHQASD